MFFLLQCVKNLLLLLPSVSFFPLYAVRLRSVSDKTHGFVDNLGAHWDMSFSSFPTEMLFAVRTFDLMRVVERSLDQFGLLLLPLG